MSINHQIAPENAALLLDWLRTRGGIAIWDSVNLANPGQTWTTPIRNADGTPRTEKPHWSAGGIIRTLTDPAEVEVVVPKEVNRFHVAVRMGGNGLVLKLTDASSRRVRRAVERAEVQHGNAWYEFDYATQEAVIFVAGEVTPLVEWEKPQAGVVEDGFF